MTGDSIVAFVSANLPVLLCLLGLIALGIAFVRWREPLLALLSKR